jgi:membrane-bound lytic murein transglycosylase B
MNPRTKIAASILIGLAIANYFVWSLYSDQLEFANSFFVIRRVALHTATPTPISTPETILALSPRMQYVYDELVQQDYVSEDVEAILTDQRLILYPEISVSYKDPDWSIIENKLYADEYVSKGLSYIENNKGAFVASEQRFGIPQEFLAALIAMETDFGNHTGNYTTVSALYSRMEHGSEDRFISRAQQLIALASYCLDTGIDCYSVTGSYAGAIGIVQFLPSSLLVYGIDGNEDGIIDLSNPIDAIPSGANYLAKHGWADDPHYALTRYYGSSEGYPDIVSKYAELLRQAQ